MDEIPVINMAPAAKKDKKKFYIVGAAIVAVLAVLAFTVISKPAGNGFTLTVGVGGNNKSAGMESDSMLAMGLWNEYVAGEGLTGEAGTAAVYSTSTIPLDTLVAKLSSLFNIKGETTEDSGKGYYSMSKGEEDPKVTDYVAYKGYFLNVYGTSKEGSLMWSVYDAESSQIVYTDSEEIVPIKETKKEVIESESIRILDALGYDSSSYRLEIVQGSSIAVLQLEGEDTPNYIQFSFMDGKIQSVSGTNIIGYKKVSDAPTVSARDAVERLNDFRWYAAAPYDFTLPAIAYSDAVKSGIAEEVTVGGGEVACAPDEDCQSVTGTVTGEAGSTEGSTGSGVISTDPVEPVDPTDEPVAVDEPTDGVIAPAPEPMPMPEKQIIPVVSAKKVWVSVEAADGSTYIVRGWSFFTKDNKEYSVGAVIALPEGVIKFKEVDMVPMGRD